MGLKEVLLRSNQGDKSTAEKLTRLSKWFDVGAVFLALVAGGIAPALANSLIQASVATFAGAEVLEKELKRRKNK